jgi:hypothetical protein
MLRTDGRSDDVLSNAWRGAYALQLRAMSALRYLALMPHIKRVCPAAQDQALQGPCVAKLGGFRVEHSGVAGFI